MNDYNESINEAMPFTARHDPRFGGLKQPPIDSMPAAMLIKRKSIRVFPDGLKVAIYYADALDRYISIPFNEVGMTNSIQEEVDEVINNKMSFLERVQHLRESSKQYKKVVLHNVDDEKFDKAYDNIEKATNVYKSKDYKTGDEHAKKAGKLEELSQTMMAKYAVSAGKDSRKAFAVGDAERWRKREHGTKLALSKMRGETKKDRANKPQHPLGVMEPKFLKPKFTKAELSNFKPKTWQWNEESEQINEVVPAIVGAAAGYAAKKFGSWAVNKVLGGNNTPNNAANNNSSSNEPDYTKHDPDNVSKLNTTDVAVHSPFDKSTPKPAKTKKDRDDEQDDQIADLRKRTKAGGNNINEVFMYDFSDGSVQVTGAVLNDIANVYEKASTINKKRIIQSITESADSFRKFADFAIKTKDKIR